MDFTPFFQILLSALLGSIIGLEREHVGKSAGMRTYSLVSIGATLFTILSISSFGDSPNIDPSRIAGQVVVGIGFLGAGVIMHQGARVRGLTTAAALWTIAAVGVAVGVREYWLATFTTVLVFSILSVMARLMKSENESLP